MTNDAGDTTGPTSDFGGLVHRVPARLHRPTTPEQVAAVVRDGARDTRPVVVRGEGHSTGGQAQADGGDLVHLSDLDEVLEVHDDRVVVQAGIRWSVLLDAVLARGLTPPVLPNFLELSVGGTLVAGGVGGTAHRHGLQTDSVLELDVVTGRGELRTCVPGDDLFDHVLGGLGLCGVITRATIALVAAPAVVRRTLVDCPDLAALVASQRTVVADGRAAYVEGMIVVGDAPGDRRFVLDLATFDELVEPEELLRGLDVLPTRSVVTDWEYRAFVHRMAAGVEAWRSAGDWFHPHPALNLFLPDAEVLDVVGPLADELTLRDVGRSGVVFLYPVRARGRALPALPAGDLVFFFALLRAAPPADLATSDAMVAHNTALHRIARSRGGTLYPVGSTAMDGADWAAQFGAAWPGLCAAKKAHDPAGVLGAGQRVFPAP